VALAARIGHGSGGRGNKCGNTSAEPTSCVVGANVSAQGLRLIQRATACSLRSWGQWYVRIRWDVLCAQKKIATPKPPPPVLVLYAGDDPLDRERRVCSSINASSYDHILPAFSFLPLLLSCVSSACDSLRCTDCNFEVLCFHAQAWEESTMDYMFLRNNAPDRAKLGARLLPCPGVLSILDPFGKSSTRSAEICRLRSLSRWSRWQHRHGAWPTLNTGARFFDWMRFSSDACAYACQCSWHTVKELRLLPPTGRPRWACGGHIAQ